MESRKLNNPLYIYRLHQIGTLTPIIAPLRLKGISMYIKGIYRGAGFYLGY